MNEDYLQNYFHGSKYGMYMDGCGDHGWHDIAYVLDQVEVIDHEMGVDEDLANEVWTQILGSKASGKSVWSVMYWTDEDDPRTAVVCSMACASVCEEALLDDGYTIHIDTCTGQDASACHECGAAI